MKKKERSLWILSGSMLILFVVWTILVQIVDVRPIGCEQTMIGFAAFNIGFHKMMGVHMLLYTLTDWLGLVPFLVSMVLGAVGVIQLVKRRSLWKVDYDLTLLGIYYVIVIFCYLIFERYPINYRPILIEGRLEASYPSSTTLLVLSVMPTLIFQINRRWNEAIEKKVMSILIYIFTVLMVVGRLVAGVHWLTDIIGSVILSMGLFSGYKAGVISADKKALRKR